MKVRGSSARVAFGNDMIACIVAGCHTCSDTTVATVLRSASNLGTPPSTACLKPRILARQLAAKTAATRRAHGCFVASTACALRRPPGLLVAVSRVRRRQNGNMAVTNVRAHTRELSDSKRIGLCCAQRRLLNPTVTVSGASSSSRRCPIRLQVCDERSVHLEPCRAHILGALHPAFVDERVTPVRHG